MDEAGYDYEILFLDASDQTLVKRYKETRRKHPLAGEGRVENGIIKEREQLAFMKKRADYIIDTSHMLTRELKAELDKIFMHSDLLRESASDPGNDHRLGANEAPPAIVSVFLGEQLEDVLEQLISTGTATHSIKGGKLMTDVKTIPTFGQDATDRNRTSPFAFTGNKFEFRMLGSRDSVSAPNVVLNTIVAESFSDACDILEKSDDFDMAVHGETSAVYGF